MNKITQFARTSAIYFVGQVATKIVAFFLLPLYSNRFSTEAYGYYDYALSILNVIVPLICLEIWSCILRFMFDYVEKQKKYSVITNGLCIFLVSFVLYTIGFIVANQLFDIQYVWYIYTYGAFLMFQNLYGVMARGLGYNVLYMISGVISSTALIVCNIILIVGFNRSVETMFISGSVGGIVTVLILEPKIQLLKNIHMKDIDKKLLGEMFRFSAPLCVNTVAFWLLNSYGKIPIKQYLGIEQNGIYAMASRFTTVLAMLVSVFQLAWQELTFSIGNNDDRSDYYNKGLNLLVRFLGCCMLMLLPFTKLAFTLINSNYETALAIIPMYYLGTMASSLSAFLGNIFSAEKKNMIIMTSTVVAAIVNIAVIQITIKPLGLHGVTLALFLGFAANIAIRIVMLKKYVDLQLEYKSFVIIGGVYVLSTIIFYKFNNLFNAGWLCILIAFSLYEFRDLVCILWEKIKGMFQSR